MEKRRADQIAEQLEELIFTGRYADGDRLDEVKLAERFGVSRTPLREAFQRLAQSGLLEQIPHRGTFVRQPGPIELLEMFEVMAELEAICGRYAARRITDEALKELAATNAACNAAVAADNPDRYFTENQRFHALIYAQSGNGFLEREASRLSHRLRPFRRQQLRLRGRLRQSMDEHEAILDALRAGDEARAGQLLYDHVAVQGEKFHHLMATMKAAE